MSATDGTDIAARYGLPVVRAVKADPDWRGWPVGFSLKLSRVVEWEGSTYRTILLRRPTVDEVREYRLNETGPMKLLSKITNFPEDFFAALPLCDGAQCLAALGSLAAATEQEGAP